MRLKHAATSGVVCLFGLLALVSCDGASQDSGSATQAEQITSATPTSPPQSSLPVTAEATSPTEVPATPEPDPPLVGISLPDKDADRWGPTGERLQADLEAMGYRTDLQFFDYDSEVLVSQIENQVEAGAAVLVLSPLESVELASVLQKAADQGIVIIACEWLPWNTENVDYLVTYNIEDSGRLQGEYLRDALALDSPGASFTFESFTGSEDSDATRWFFMGAWEVLQRFFFQGKLVCLSTRCPAVVEDVYEASIHGFKSEIAQVEMAERLASSYQHQKVEAILAPTDSMALGIAAALEQAGYQPGIDWPLLTGHDADLDNLRLILAGKQSMTLFKDVLLLADGIAQMVDQVLKGEPVQTTTTYDNNLIEVPTLIVSPVVVTRDNIEETLIDTGYYTKAELGL